MESFELEIWVREESKQVFFINVKAESIEQAVEKAKEQIKNPFRIFYKNYKVN